MKFHIDLKILNFQVPKNPKDFLGHGFGQAFFKRLGVLTMCLACSIAESAYSKQEKQIDYSANQEYNNQSY